MLPFLPFIVTSKSVCMCVCLSVREDISGTTRTVFTVFLCMLPMAVARSFVRHCCNALCTSGFVVKWYEFRLSLLLTIKSDRIQFLVIKGHNFD